MAEMPWNAIQKKAFTTEVTCHPTCREPNESLQDPKRPHSSGNKKLSQKFWSAMPTTRKSKWMMNWRFSQSRSTWHDFVFYSETMSRPSLWQVLLQMDLDYTSTLISIRCSSIASIYNNTCPTFKYLSQRFVWGQTDYLDGIRQYIFYTQSALDLGSLENRQLPKAIVLGKLCYLGFLAWSDWQTFKALN